MLSLLLVFVVNKQSFGWTVQFHPPFALLSALVSGLVRDDSSGAVSRARGIASEPDW